MMRRLFAEARLFEPLTWLEAAVFFVLVLAVRECPRLIAFCSRTH